MKKRKLLSFIMALAITFSTINTSFVFAAEEVISDAPIQSEEVAVIDITQTEAAVLSNDNTSIADTETAPVTTDSAFSDENPVIEDELQSDGNYLLADGELLADEITSGSGDENSVQGEGNIDGVSGTGVTDITPYIPNPEYPGNISGSYTGTVENNLTVLLRGLNDDNKQDTYDKINYYISAILETGKRLSITGDYVDAEKYNYVTDGYDANHCWAATTSNILWTTGYAGNIVNPITNEKFKSEDEVLSYFSENFTDDAGNPESGCRWFMNGVLKDITAQLLDSDALSDVLKDKQRGGLNNLNDLASRQFSTNIYGDNYTGISVLSSVGAYGLGVLIRWVQDDGTLSSGAHWMAVVGSVIDNAKTKVEEKYKAIILANSDDSVPNGELSASYEDKLSTKIAQPNKYVVCKLTYDKNYNAWTIQGLSAKTTVITYLYGLMDSDKNPEGGDSSSTNNSEALKYTKDRIDYTTIEEVTSIAENAQADVIYLIIEDNNNSQSNNVIVEGNPNVSDFTYESLTKPENVEKLYSYMLTNALPVFSPSNGIVNTEQNYEAYVTASNTAITGVAINDVQISASDYSVVLAHDGLAKIVLSQEFLKKLPKGRHTLKIKIDGMSEELEISFIIE